MFMGMGLLWWTLIGYLEHVLSGVGFSKDAYAKIIIFLLL